MTGTAGSVGMAGLTLGGGYGPLGGRFGLALDNLLSAEVVLADGGVVTADAEHEPDLFWALRGGGGNFGVVTSMRIRLHRLRTLLSGLVMYPWDQAPAVLTALAEELPEAPDELTAQFGVLTGPADEPVVFVAPTWSGDDAAAGGARAGPLRRPGHPARRAYGPRDHAGPTGGHRRAVPLRPARRDPPAVGAGAHPRGARGAARRGLRTDLAALGGVGAQPARRRGARARGGDGVRQPRPASDDRDPRPVGADDPEPARHRAWAAGLAKALEPEALPGTYPNLLGPDETAHIAHSFGPHAQRLLAVKRRTDPDGVFRALPLPAGPGGA
ncbi:FAD-binding oxidoreductase [Streptomyces sp. PG2]